MGDPQLVYFNSDKNVPSCHTFRADHWIRLCSDLYPKKIRSRFNNRLVKHLEPFSVFRRKDAADIMAVFNVMGLEKCTHVFFKSMDQILCGTQNGYLPDPVKAYASVIACLSYHLHLIDDLNSVCLQGRPQNSFNLTKTKVVQHRTILFYNFGQQRLSEHLHESYKGMNNNTFKADGAAEFHLTFWILILSVVLTILIRRFI